MLMQNFGGTKKSIVVNSKVAYYADLGGCIILHIIRKLNSRTVLLFVQSTVEPLLWDTSI